MANSAFKNAEFAKTIFFFRNPFHHLPFFSKNKRKIIFIYVQSIFSFINKHFKYVILRHTNVSQNSFVKNKHFKCPLMYAHMRMLFFLISGFNHMIPSVHITAQIISNLECWFILWNQMSLFSEVLQSHGHGCKSSIACWLVRPGDARQSSWGLFAKLYS